MTDQRPFLLWFFFSTACTTTLVGGTGLGSDGSESGGSEGGDDSHVGSESDQSTTRADDETTDGSTDDRGSDDDDGDSTTASSTDGGDTSPPLGCSDAPSIVGVEYDGEFNYATSFPIALSFDDDAYATTSPIVWVGSGAAHEHVVDGGIDGCGAARIYPPAEGEHMAGIGQVLGLRNVEDTPRLTIRYCIDVGPSFPTLSSGAKPIILWRADPSTDVQGHDDAVGARPMVISRDDPEGRGIAYGMCDGTVCTYVGGDFWPDGSDTWLLDGERWSCLEFDFDLENDRMDLYVTTDDGEFFDTPYLSATFRDELSGPGGVFTAIDTVGGYFAQSMSDPDNYYDIDALVIDTEHIGPPAGFGR